MKVPRDVFCAVRKRNAVIHAASELWHNLNPQTFGVIITERREGWWSKMFKEKWIRWPLSGIQFLELQIPSIWVECRVLSRCCRLGLPVRVVDPSRFDTFYGRFRMLGGAFFEQDCGIEPRLWLSRCVLSLTIASVSKDSVLRWCFDLKRVILVGQTNNVFVVLVPFAAPNIRMGRFKSSGNQWVKVVAKDLRWGKYIHTNLKLTADFSFENLIPWR